MNKNYPALSDKVHIPKQGTKTHMVLKGLTGKGLTIEKIQKMTGWKRTSAYGAIHEDIRNRCGLAVKRRDGVYTAKLPARVHL